METVTTLHHHTHSLAHREYGRLPAPLPPQLRSVYGQDMNNGHRIISESYSLCGGNVQSSFFVSACHCRPVDIDFPSETVTSGHRRRVTSGHRRRVTSGHRRRVTSGHRHSTRLHCLLYCTVLYCTVAHLSKSFQIN